MGKVRFKKPIMWKGQGQFDVSYDKESQVQQLTIFCYHKKGLANWMKRLSRNDENMQFVLTISPAVNKTKTKRGK